MKTIALLDLDCFYVQVERKCNPHLLLKPCAVVQYNPWKGGGIIALSYEAKNCGVTRGMRGEDAKAICPEIQLITVPEARGKANLNKYFFKVLIRYREESTKIIEVLKEFSPDIERASIDEAYIDLTTLIEKDIFVLNSITLNTCLLKNLYRIISPEKMAALFKDTCFAPSKMICTEDDINRFLEQCNSLPEIKIWLSLLYGGIITKKIRDTIMSRCGYQCSAGIAQNKMLAKLGCGLNKPNKQTIVTPGNIEKLYESIPIKKISGLGGNFGDTLQKRYKIEKMSELATIPLAKLIDDFGEKHGTWLHNISLGINDEPVKNRLIPKSLGCGKNFSGKRALVRMETIKHWFTQLINELIERLAKDKLLNDRSPKTFHIGLGQNIHTDTNRVSHQFPFPNHYKDPEDLVRICLRNIKKFNSSADPDSWDPAITNITLSATNFRTDNPNTNSLASFLTDTSSNIENSNDIFSDKSTKTKKNLSPPPIIVHEKDIKVKTRSGKSSLRKENSSTKESKHNTTPKKVKTSGNHQDSSVISLNSESDDTDVPPPSTSGLNNFMPTDWSQVDRDVLNEIPDTLKWQISDNLDYKDMTLKQRNSKKSNSNVSTDSGGTSSNIKDQSKTNRKIHKTRSKSKNIKSKVSKNEGNSNSSPNINHYLQNK